ncbi:MAG: Ig-like domain repeat protein [Acidobacteriia bacterium]|nr:Ig-like domain repeat protein [Terriglobia bacterium]
MQTQRMFRPTVVLPSLILSLVVAAACFAQSVPQHNSTANPPSAGATLPQLPPSAAPEADTDSADIPPFARGRISEEEYFALRDQEIRTRRGIDDLLHNPQARSQAVRTMEFQEKVLRLVTQGLTPFSALIPAAPVASWTALGPAPIPNGQTSPSEVAVSGRVTAIAVDPTDANIVYAGTAQGGVYRSLDGGASWTPLLDTAQSLAIGAITIDPSTPTTVFVGTGEGNLSGDSFFGVGIYIIRTATTAPVVTGPFNSNGVSDVFTGRAITRIIVNPADSNKILVSTASGVSGLSGDSFNTLPARGVFLSTNALGTTPTFTKQTVQTGLGAAQDRTVTDMVMDPGNASSILVYVFGAAAAGDGGVWVSTAGDPWAGTATWTQTITRSGFGKFAVNRSGAGPTTTFALAQDETVPCGGVITSAGSLKTSLDGVTWTPLAAANGFCGGQCFYDMVPAFHPDDVNTIYLGGSADGTAGTCSNRAFSKSTNGGTSFAANDALLHADSHALAFAPSNHNVIYVGNDGGIFKSIDAGNTWTSVNTNGFNATQFVSLSVHPTDANFSIGGTQDNGTEFFQPNATWTRADFGDGGYSAIDQSSTDATNVTMYHTYFNQTNGLIAFARVTNVANATEGAWSVFGCPAQPGLTVNGITCTDAVLFYAPLALGPGNPNTLYFGTDHLYRSADRGATMPAVSQANFGCCDTQGRNFRVSAIGVSAQNDNVRIVGLTNGKAFATTTGANPMTDVTGPWTAKFIARAVIDPNNSNTAYVTLDGYGTASHVWKTTNLAAGAGSWAASSTGLPDVPVNAFAVDPLNSNYLYAGTDIGVFNSIDAGATWAAYGTGLPRVAVFDLNVQKTSHKVRMGTHGRGAWEIAAAAAFPNTLGLSPSSATPGLGSNVTFTATINKGTGVPVPTGTVTFTEGATLLGSGSVNGSGIATFSTTTLTQGAHQIFSTYNGDSLYAGSTSNTVTVTVGPIVIPPDFSVTIPNGSATIPAGQSATYTISVTPSGGFNSAVSFACTGLPGASNCSFSPTTVTPNGSPASTTLTIATTVRTTASAQPLTGITLAALTSFGFLGIVFLGIPSKRRRSLRLAGTLMLILAIIMVVTSCGGDKHVPVTTGTPAGNFTVTVTSTSGATTHSSTITLVVQ